jgi:hypothetical protein
LLPKENPSNQKLHTSFRKLQTSFRKQKSYRKLKTSYQKLKTSYRNLKAQKVSTQKKIQVTECPTSYHHQQNGKMEQGTQSEASRIRYLGVGHVACDLGSRLFIIIFGDFAKISAGKRRFSRQQLQCSDRHFLHRWM